MINTITDISIITSSSLNIYIPKGIFSLILYHLLKIKNSSHRVPLLLIANMYLALLVFGITCAIQYIWVLPGHFYSLISLNDRIYCQNRIYFQLVSVCGVFYSSSLQSIYRLCRVVFCDKQSFQSFQLYQKLIIIQQIICFIIMIPAFLFNDLKYSVL